MVFGMCVVPAWCEGACVRVWCLHGAKVHMCMCVMSAWCEGACVCVWCLHGVKMHVYVEARSQWQVDSSIVHPPAFLRYRLSLNLELID